MIFFGVIVALVVLSQLILYFSISRHEGFSSKINLASRQKSIAQEIVKILLLQHNSTTINQDGQADLLHLSTLQEKWSNSQTGLVNGSKLYKIDGNNSAQIQDLFQRISPDFLRMNELVAGIVANNTFQADIEVVNEIVTLESQYNKAMTEVHSQLVKEQESSVNSTRKLGWFLGLISTILLSLAFVFIVRPTLQRLNKQNGELKEINESLEAASASKNEFIAGISRELARPVNNLVGLTDVLAEANSIEEARKVARNIRTGTENLARLLSDMSDFTLIQNNELELDSERFALRPMLEELMENIKPQIPSRELELILDFDSGIGAEIIQDKYRLQQVLRQLIENAIQFTEKGEIIVSVKKVREEFSFMQFQFSVKDTGVGFDKAKAESIFEVASVRLPGKSRKSSGANLGLAICKMLVEKMGGKIWVESEPLVGSTFNFTMVAEVSEVSHETLLNSLNGVKALVVDDNKTNLKILVRQLSTWGIQATPFNSPELVAELIGNLRKFDICLIDLEMPEMDGKQLAIKIHEQYPERDFPLIALSSANKQYLEDRDSLFSAYITKPVKQSQLLDVIVKALGVKTKDSRASSEVHSMHNGLKVLIAQDNELLRAVAAKTLKSLGCKYENARSGRQVLDKIRSSEFDLLLVDVGLPELDGIETARKIKSSFHGKNQPVIIGLSEDVNRDRQRCLQAGMDDCMNYAVNSLDLEEHINKFFEEQVD